MVTSSGGERRRPRGGGEPAGRRRGPEGAAPRSSSPWNRSTIPRSASRASGGSSAPRRWPGCVERGPAAWDADRPREDTVPWYRQFWPWFYHRSPPRRCWPDCHALPGGVRQRHAGQGRLLQARTRHQPGPRAGQPRPRAGHRGRAPLRPDAGRSDGSLRPALRETSREIALRLTHPTRAELDQAVTLGRRADGSFEASVLPLGPGNWHLDLLPASGEWRLSGRLAVPEQTRLELR